MLKSPHNVPSFMDIRNGHAGNSGEEVNSVADVSFDLDTQPENTLSIDDDHGPVTSDDDEVLSAHHDNGNGGAYPLVQVHEADDYQDPDLSPQSPLSPLTDDTMTNTGFTLSPPARPQQGGSGSVISLVDVNV